MATRKNTSNPGTAWVAALSKVEKMDAKTIAFAKALTKHIGDDGSTVQVAVAKVAEEAKLTPSTGNYIIGWMEKAEWLTRKSAVRSRPATFQLSIPVAPKLAAKKEVAA